MLTAALGTQCMMWETSPAAAEIEERTMDWLRQMIGLPDIFDGVIQDTASTATLCSILSAREKLNDFRINSSGYKKGTCYRVYCSEETHSSIEKAVKIAGIGSQNLIKIPVDESFRMDIEKLEVAVNKDLENGYVPLCIVATIGTTGSTAVDPISGIGEICKKNHLWLHVDAAYAGSALILEEYRWMIKGIEMADTFVFNPHKWLFTNFDCSAYYVRDKESLLRTFEILPEYLKTGTRGAVNDYRDWGIQLGRRFRALKLWFVLRSFGVLQLQEMLRRHIYFAEKLESLVKLSTNFEMMADRLFNLVCFRFHPQHISEKELLNNLNEKLVSSINNTGNAYLTHTKLKGDYVIRVVTGQTKVEESHIDKLWELINRQVEKTYSNQA